MTSEGERGIALMHSLLLVCLVVCMAGLMLKRSVAMSRDSMRHRGELQALHAAEGGLAKARHALRRDPMWTGGDLQIGACRVLVAVRQLGHGQWQITSRAISHPAGEKGMRVQVNLIEGFGKRYWYRQVN